ncbi:MAG: alpha/beta fold hydrolase [Draconibacterium sp.]|nr:alpha/beta fold hydrolase [Draconibacterium sp.]
MRRIYRFLAFVVLIVVIVYLMGPKPPQVDLNKDLPSISASIANIEDYVKKNDEGLTLKPDSESRIIWANDSVKERTAYSLLYLHGFSASWYEGYPTNVEFSRYFGCNAYFPRLASHGIETEDDLIDMTPDRLWESAKDALMIARTLGRKVIIMGTSTGGTLALKLASDFPEYVDGLILYSPNIRINNKAAFLLSKPWGLQIGQKAEGGKYRVSDEEADSKYCKYWNCKYRMEAVVFLQKLVDETMINQTYKNINEPVFLGYYYKDETHQDDVVKVDAMLKMFDHLGTSAVSKVKVAFPEAGDHVIGCELKSGAFKEVLSETVKFGEEVLKLKPAAK